jgi:multidrug efflux pump subunit AcrA (membrane-fusion protein)
VVDTGYEMSDKTSGSLGGRKFRLMALVVLGVVGGAFVLARPDAPGPAAEPTKVPVTRPALTVSLTTPQPLDWPQVLPANGNVMAWQEAVIGPEIANYRITEVRVQVGDVVKKGQVDRKSVV